MLPAVDLAQRDTVRLISTGRLKDPVLSPLAADPGALEELASLESATNGRLRAQQTGLPDLAPQELVYGRPGHTFVNAAFTHTRKGGNRFNDENRGAWYCGFDPRTSLDEVSYHLTKELENIARFENSSDYAELLADFIGPFGDARNQNPRPDYLDPDPAVGYPAGQALAKDLRAKGGNGLVYPSVRRQGGACLVAFRPDLVQNLRQGGVWRLEWQGSPRPSIGRVTQ
jgi:hypothetical protein